MALARERAALAGRLRSRGHPEADIAGRVAALGCLHAAEAAVYGYPLLAEQLRRDHHCSQLDAGSSPGPRQRSTP